MPQKHTLRNASLLFLVVVGLLVTLGAVMQALNFSWGLIGTELICILLPSLVYLALNHFSVAGFLRLRWPGWTLILLAAVAGLGLWQFDAWLDTIMASIFGYTMYLPPEAYPTTPGGAVVLFTALAISAPLCEETLFRGALLRSFQPWGPKFAILFSSALFVFFHMRLQGFAALVPVALLLGYVTWRSDSILPAVAIHFAYNAFAAVLTILGTQRPDMLLPFPSLTYAAAGLVVALAAVYLFRRAAPVVTPPAPVESAAEQVEPVPAAPPAPPRPRLVAFWPLVIAALVWIVMAGLEFLVGAHPELLALNTQLRPSIPAWNAPERLTYEIKNKAGDIVGQLDCQIAPDANIVQLSCREQVKAYKITIGSSMWQDGDHTTTFESQWSKKDGTLESYHTEIQFPGSNASVGVAKQGSQLVLTSSVDGRQEQIKMPSNTIMKDELPLRLSRSPMMMSQARWALVMWPDKYRESTKTNGPALERTLVYVEGGEPVMSPEGPALAWRVKIGKNITAWYEYKGQGRLLKYEDNMASYTLK